ncbi:autotransporter outer membrane beta-barrel domain-containing protein, partial [Aquamicrobium segne]
YRLYQGATSAPNDGNWYLRSSLIPTDPEPPLYQPGVPVYESYAQSLLGLNGLSTMQQRVGNRFWAGNGNRMISQGADAVEYYAPAEEAGVHSQGNGVWGRIEGTHNKVDPKFSSSGADYSQNALKMQAGVDMLLSEAENGMLIGGVFAHYAHGKTKVHSIFGDGTISTDGYGFGGSLTWYGNDGFYVDGQGQVTWYDSNLFSTLANTSLVSGNDGFGYALSLETGKRFAITPEWSLTPQAQLTYSNVRFDSFDDAWDAHVSLDRG